MAEDDVEAISHLEQPPRNDMPQVKLPFLIDPRKPGAYKRFKKRLSAYQEIKQYSSRRVAQLVYVEQKGEPGDLIENLDPGQEDFSMEAIYAIWDAEYNKLEHENARDVNKVYESQGRRYQQPMKTYLRMLKEARRDLEAEDDGTKVSNLRHAQRMLEKAGLNVREQRQVLSMVGAG